MKEASIMSRFRSALHERLDVVAKEPLPERWVALIQELDECERRDVLCAWRRRAPPCAHG